MKQNKSDLIVNASAKAQPGKITELEEALLEVAGPTRLGAAKDSLLYRYSRRLKG